MAHLCAQHLRRQPDIAMNVEKVSSAFADTLEHIGEDRVVERLWNIAKPGYGAPCIGDVIASFPIRIL